MKFQEYAKLLRSRWITVFSAMLAAALGAFTLTLLTTPLYEASTRLFVSTTAGASASDLYQSSRYSQERVLSYSELITGETLANRTIEKLNLEKSPQELSEQVTARATPNTVLIAVKVRDASPVQARDIANAMSEEFVEMVGELETSTAGAKPDARVVVEQRASIPAKPVIPNTALNLSLGIIIGGLLGVGLAVIRDQLDNTVKTQETLEEITGTGTVGYIPLDKELAVAPAISFDSDNSSTAEAFRKLRTNLQFLTVDHPPRVIVVTSPSPAEGKSTTSINIALALAEAERTVVLVDGDLRRPRLAKYLDVLGSVGVSTVLSGGAALDEVLQQSKFPRLSVLAAGPTPPNPSELLGSLASEKMLSELRSRFDYVIIDSAPLLAVTDGAILAAKADGALIVVKAGQTRRDQLAHAIGMLNDVGATLLGAVFTMMPTRGSGAYTYNYYHYGGSYGDEQEQQPELATALDLGAADSTSEKSRPE